MYEAAITVVVLLLLVGLLGAATADVLARRFSGEIDAWAREGVISGDQAAAIRSRYASVLGDESRLRAGNALSILGAAVVGLGVILFFAANWSEVPRLVRLALLVAAIVAAYGGGFWLTELRRGSERLGRTLILLGTLLFGASLFLVGQMYHVQAHDPLAFLLWSLAAAAIAGVTRSAATAGLAALTFYAWFVFELLRIEGEFGGVAALPPLFALLGAALYTLATAAKPWLDRFEVLGPVRTLAFASCALGLFALTFPELHEYALPHRALDHSFVQTSLWTLVAATAAGVALLLLGRERRRTAILEAAAFAAVPALVLAFLYEPDVPRGAVSRPTRELDTTVPEYPLLFTALMAVLVLGAILAGHVNRERWLMNAGVYFAALAILGRFLDPAWELLPRAVVFVAVGALVLALGWLVERRRMEEVVR